MVGQRRRLCAPGQRVGGKAVTGAIVGQRDHLAAYSGGTPDEAVTSEQVEEIRRLYEVQPRGWLDLEPA